MTPDNWQGLAAVILAILTGTAGIVASRRAEHKEQSKGPIPVTTGPIPTVSPGLTAALDSDGLTEYLKTVLGDNNDLRERLVRLETTVDQMKAADTTFRMALGRWLGRIYEGWGKQSAMPMPQGDDLITLREVLPR